MSRAGGEAGADHANADFGMLNTNWLERNCSVVRSAWLSKSGIHLSDTSIFQN
jgi:hypothetical protein